MQHAAESQAKESGARKRTQVQRARDVEEGVNTALQVLSAESCVSKLNGALARAKVFKGDQMSWGKEQAGRQIHNARARTNREHVEDTSTRHQVLVIVDRRH
eukprot:1144290-Pleurochrysis_carterae.AAC.1